MLVRGFEVFSDDPANTTPRGVIEACGSLAGIYIGSPHPDWPAARCEEIDPGEELLVEFAGDLLLIERKHQILAEGIGDDLHLFQ